MTRIRLATAVDNERLLAFQTRYAMLSGMPLRFDRSPDYFALHRCHSNDCRTWLAEDSAGRVKGIASMVVRDGYLAGEKQRIAYLGDLRIAPDRELAHTWVDYVVDRFADLARHEGVQHTYCCVIRDNRIATQSLFRTGKRPRLGFRHWRGYSNVSIYARRIAARSAGSVRITNASAADADALRTFLDQESRSQPFGCVFTADEFARRLNAWPDFGIERFLVARNAQRRIVGCVAPWDAGRIKRIVLERLPRSLGALRHSFNAIAPLLGRPPHRSSRPAAPGYLPDSSACERTRPGHCTGVARCGLATRVEPLCLAAALPVRSRSAMARLAGLSIHRITDGSIHAIRARRERTRFRHHRSNPRIRDLSRLTACDRCRPRAVQERNECKPETPRIEAGAAEHRLAMVEMWHANSRYAANRLVVEVELSVMRTAGTVAVEA